MGLTFYPEDLNIAVQSVEVAGSRKQGQSSAYKSATWDRSVLTAPGEPWTLFELFDQSVARHPDRAVILRRPLLPGPAPLPTEVPVYSNTLVPTSYAQLQTRRSNLGTALLALERGGRLRSSKSPASQQTPLEVTHPGIPYYGINNRLKGGARRGWAVGSWMKNCEEWQVIDLAASAYGLVAVSLYETLGADVAENITNHVPLSIIFASQNHIPSLLKIVPKCPTLRMIVSIEPLTRPERDVLEQWARSVDVELAVMSELEQWGSEAGIRLDPGPVKGIPGELELDRDRIITISYTSGTTGNPKGVVLTNANVTQAVISNALGGAGPFSAHGEEWRYLAFMPLSHIYERFLENLVMYSDGTICYTTGDVTKLLEDAQLIKAHFMAGVPRVFNRIHAAVKAQMALPGLKGALLRKAVAAKLANWRATGQVKHSIYDALVFRKIRNLLGGQLQWVSSGAAPLSADVHEMLKICLSCDVIQGYGMTETVGTASKGIPWDVDAVGTVGQIQPVNEIKLVDVPEMNYTASDLLHPRGEVCFKGGNITPGYLHDPENTAKLIDADGWMHSGDIGEIDSAGRLKIIDRIKNVVKLSQGEYVALEKLEGIYALDPVFASLLVHGDSSRSHLIALGVLDPLQAAPLVKSILGKDVLPTDIATLDDLVRDKKVRAAVLKRLRTAAKEYKLNGFETIKGVHLQMMPFTEDCLTPTLKVKRNVAAKKYAKEIDQVYQETESAGDSGAIAKL